MSKKSRKAGKNQQKKTSSSSNHSQSESLSQSNREVNVQPTDLQMTDDQETGIVLTTDQLIDQNAIKDSTPSVAQRVAMRLLALCIGGFLLIYLQSILIPLVLGILLVFVLTPMTFKFQSWGMSQGLAVVTSQMVALVVILGAFMSFAITVGPLSRALPKYRNALVHEITQGIEWASGRINNPEARSALKHEISESILPKAIDQGVKITQKGLSATTSLLGYFFLTLLLSTFMLLEAAHLREKLAEAYNDQHPLLISMKDIGEDVRAYMVAKTLISLFTSVCVWVVLTLAQVDFAVFWALLAFPLNFIPTVGAIVASLPPIIIAMIDPELSLMAVTFVTIGLFVVNGFIGSVIDPRYVGQKVKLSPLTVLLSMLLWGVLWGPVGMILAVPIMVSIKVIFSHTPGLEPISIIMRG